MRRILFIDDADITAMQGLIRTIHPAQKHGDNPVVQPEQPWEEDLIIGGTVRLEPERGYRMWYQSYGHRTYINLYAESQDGVHWTKPTLGQYEDFEGNRQNNIFLSRMALRSNYLRPPQTNQDHNPNVLYTPHLGAESAYTLLSYDYARSGYGPYDGYYLAFSPDGIHWHDGPREPVIANHADVGWFAYDEADRKFRGMVKTYLNVRGHFRRSVLWTESRDGFEWLIPRPAVLPDLQDEAWAEGQRGCHTQFYGMPIMRYESVLVGFLQVFRVMDEENPSHDGEVDVQLTCSRDGHTWTRVGDRQPILALGPRGSWDGGGVYGGNALVMDGDQVRLYYSGTNGTHADPKAKARIGLASWPRDRFVGLHATVAGGWLQTTLHLAGKRLHINASVSDGEVRAEVVDADGQVITGCEALLCEPLQSDALDHVCRWQGLPPDLSGRLVAVRLHLQDAEVFSMWWE